KGIVTLAIITRQRGDPLIGRRQENQWVGVSRVARWTPPESTILGQRDNALPSCSRFRTLRVYGRLALQTNLKSGVRIVTEQRNPRLMSHFFDFRRTKVGEERDRASALRRITLRTFGAPSRPVVAT